MLRRNCDREVEHGRHTKFYKNGRHVAVPRHAEIAGGTTAAILKRAAVIGLLALLMAYAVQFF